MSKLLTILFLVSAFFAHGQNSNSRTFDAVAYLDTYADDYISRIRNKKVSGVCYVHNDRIGAAQGLIDFFDDFYKSVRMQNWRPEDLKGPNSFRRQALIDFFSTAGVVYRVDPDKPMDVLYTAKKGDILIIVSSMQSGGDGYVTNVEFYPVFSAGKTRKLEEGGMLYYDYTVFTLPTSYNGLHSEIVTCGQNLDKGLIELALDQEVYQVKNDPDDDLPPPAFILFRPKLRETSCVSTNAKSRKKRNCF